MDVVFTRCAGLDVHKKSITACRMVPDPTGREAEGIMELRTFGTLTRDLLSLADWLTEASITHVAMESTGEYWKPVYNLLEDTFTVFLVNAAHVKNVPGRKTDKADARWLAKLMRFGLLQASFIPPKGQRDLRDLTRYRTKLVQERVREVNRVQGVLSTWTEIFIFTLLQRKWCNLYQNVAECLLETGANTAKTYKQKMVTSSTS